MVFSSGRVAITFERLIKALLDVDDCEFSPQSISVEPECPLAISVGCVSVHLERSVIRAMPLVRLDANEHRQDILGGLRCGWVDRVIAGGPSR